MNLERVSRLAESLDCMLLEREPLAGHVTLGIGGAAPFYARPASWKTAEELLLGLWSEDVPFRVLGGGSNLLVAEGLLPFGVVQLRRLGGDIRWSGESAEVDADVPLPALATESVRLGLSGLEGMGGIPGTVGGAVVMNAGAFGSDMAKILREVAIIERDKGLVWHPASEFALEYRRTNIRERGVVAACRLAFAQGNPDTIAAFFDETKAKRLATQPWKQATAGSVFKNPPGSFAGRILEGLGFKGKRRGNVGFSDLHANFLVNHGGGSFEDAMALCEDARAAAAAQGFLLELEMEVWP